MGAGEIFFIGRKKTLDTGDENGYNGCMMRQGQQPVTRKGSTMTRIKWKNIGNNGAAYAYVGEVRVGWVEWSSLASHTGFPWKSVCKLPGFRDPESLHDDYKLAVERVENAVRLWLDKAGLRQVDGR